MERAEQARMAPFRLCTEPVALHFIFRHGSSPSSGLSRAKSSRSASWPCETASQKKTASAGAVKSCCASGATCSVRLARHVVWRVFFAHFAARLLRYRAAFGAIFGIRRKEACWPLPHGSSACVCTQMASAHKPGVKDFTMTWTSLRDVSVSKR